MSEQRLKLDLGCGQHKKAGFLGVDVADIPDVDVVHNLESFPWPFDDESVVEVHCSHFVEHLSDFYGFFDELWRVMKLGAEAMIICPYGMSFGAFQDPTHKRFILPQTFWYTEKAGREKMGLSHYNEKCNFSFTYGYKLAPEWQTRNRETVEYGLKHYWNVAEEVHVKLVKLPL